ncbi:related to Staphylococcus multidrug resistance protein [Ramularia collo-cygni]|uniref:Related to Staphylococcus multidrug resistance protein n=1 Tax=Ramularia collo-cygni TaxID=112498 RepID=A0A2D3V450_9PEZI|nr:related to Staphylococcus multidrug resistance protein [Ramularia collo-cygni]CZT19457.1 related to Staphylococcus multidrug resistance protein [Ramularia collo-cygni]
MAKMETEARALPHTGAKIIWNSSWDVKVLLLLRMIRLVGYGGTTFVLALYLNALGFSDPEVGVFMTSTLLGTLIIGVALTYVGDGLGVRSTAIVGGLLMCASGVAFAWLDNFWLLLLASIAGVISPSANEIDPFKPVEEAALARLSSLESRNAVFAWWTMLGMLGTAGSNLLAGWIIDASQTWGYQPIDSYRIIFLGYSCIGVVKLLCCALLSREAELATSDREATSFPSESDAEAEAEREPLLGRSSGSRGHASVAAGTHPSKPLAAVRKRSPVFSPTSFTFMWQLSLALAFDFIGSGLAQMSWMTYFFKREYDVKESAMGSATFIAGIASSILNLASSSLSDSIGQVQTMVLCHSLNAISLLMISVPGNKYVALALFIFRIVTREVDNAPRQSFISAGVLDSERTAAMGVVNIVKTIGSCIGLYSTGIFAGCDLFWLAFIVAGALKLVYNLLIIVFFWRKAR